MLGERFFSFLVHEHVTCISVLFNIVITFIRVFVIFLGACFTSKKIIIAGYGLRVLCLNAETRQYLFVLVK